MAKVKVMHLLQSDRFSGAESVVCQIIDAFSDNDDYEMCYVCPFGPIEDVLKKRHISYYGLKSFSSEEIDLAINTINPDIIHAHDFNASVRAAKYKTKCIISHIHNNPLWFSKLDYRTIVYTLCLSRFKHIIGVSNSIRDEYLFSKKIEAIFSVLPNVVDKNRVLRLSKERGGVTSDLLYIGRFSHEKNPLDFLKIIKMLKEKKPDIKAVMVGEGALYDTCQDYIGDNDLSENVQLMGFTANPYKYINNTSILVMTSVYEGFGLVAVEAMILGKPVICHPVGGLVDIVDESTGVLCESLEEYKTAISNLLCDVKKRDELGLNAKNKADKYCDLSLYKNAINSIYVNSLK